MPEVEEVPTLVSGEIKPADDAQATAAFQKEDADGSGALNVHEFVLLNHDVKAQHQVEEDIDVDEEKALTEQVSFLPLSPAVCCSLLLHLWLWLILSRGCAVNCAWVPPCHGS